MKIRNAESRKRKDSPNSTFTVWGLICGFFDGIALKLYQNSFFGKYFSSYDKFEEKAEKSCVTGIITDWHRKHYKSKYHPKKEIGTEQIDENLVIYNASTIRQPVSKRLRKAIYENRIMSVISEKVTDIPRVSASSIGLLILSMTLVSVIIQMAKFLLVGESAELIYLLCNGLVLIVVSVPMLTKGNISIYEYVMTSRIGHYVFTPLMGVEDNPAENEIKVDDKIGKRANFVSFFVGILLGMLTFKLSLLNVVWLFIAFCAISCIIRTPEAGLLIFGFAIPFSETSDIFAALLCTLVFLTAISYIAKIAVGKRAVKFELIDFVIVSYFIYLILGEFFTDAEGKGSRMVFLLSCVCVYFLCKNMLCYSKWLDKFQTAFFASATVAAAYGIVCAAIRKEIGITSFFKTQEHFAVYLLLALFITLSLSFTKKISVFASVFSLSVQIAALVLTGSKTAAISLIVTFFIFTAIAYRKMFAWVLFALVSCPILLPFLPETISNKILSVLLFTDNSFLRFTEIWKNSLAVARINPVSGIGLSSELLEKTYSMVTGGLTLGSESTGSLYVYLFATTGIIGFCFFALVVLLYLRAVLSFYERIREGQNTKNRFCAVCCAVFSVIVCGLGVFVFDSSVCTYLFLASVGISLAIKRRLEEESVSADIESDAFQSEINLNR